MWQHCGTYSHTQSHSPDPWRENKYQRPYPGDHGTIVHRQLLKISRRCSVASRHVPPHQPEVTHARAHPMNAGAEVGPAERSDVAKARELAVTCRNFRGVRSAGTGKVVTSESSVPHGFR